MANSEFAFKFYDASVKIHPSGLSDHSPVVLSFKGGAREKRYGFKFDNFLTIHPDFLQIVKDEWANHIEGTFMFRVTSHLKALKTPLRKLRKSYGNLGQRVSFLKTELDRIQLDVDSDPSNDELGLELGHIRIAYQNACWVEECAAKQRAKINWLNEGDMNTKFFHKVIKDRNYCNSIQSVCSSGGEYFYGEDVPKNSLFIGCKLYDPADFDEIKNAMFSIGDYKAPGSDGFSSKFFKQAWEIVGRDVTLAVHNFFYRGNLPKNLNHTLICLIPKSLNASRVTDYRPIACCNVLYKCISKVIVNRMKGSLDSLIDKAQLAFIPGRRITDNILMAHELVSGYQSSNGPPRCAFKIDIKKAYDTVDWRFLVVMLEGLGFHPVLGFSMLLKQCIREAAEFGYHRGCEELELTHLCFADDLFVFTKGDVLSVEVLKKAIYLFQCRSGLAPSLEKSEIYFGNVPSNIKEAILECLPFKLGSFPVRYLGVPLSQARLKLCDYAPLIAKVKGRIINWKSKFLSFGGRRQLIISVLQSLQLHWMSVFLLPSGIIHDIESIFRKFLWAPRDDLRGRCRLSWDVVCRLLDAGGLGIKRLSIWNRALLVKHVWDVVRRRDSLWVSWIYGQYLRSSHFWMIGDGRATNAWEDNWLSYGHLSAFISYRFVHSCGFSTSTTVRDLLQHWDVLWGEDRNSAADFLVSNACTLLEGVHPVVPWHKAVWFPGHIPKHAFCLWLCPYAREVWDSILHVMALTDMPSTWDLFMKTISDSNHRPNRLNQKLAVAASVYYIWQDRNRRLFTGESRTYLQLVKVIVDAISMRVDWLSRRPV
ncbi:uncharacterized protein LOC112514118 [Cynara cardunculus var. scolymus]|uniref:uncharacterized protein LOC112514118 n=1 Tax=Cynara cardunculus var. scolymus TaxID=59895 RepID=UPI000D62C61B|nr:uncharacterized protein LOC112514118 [Cynara cardunculus var. scolymus]